MIFSRFCPKAGRKIAFKPIARPVKLRVVDKLQVLAAVKGLVHENIAIVSTIHSPTPFCFSLFDSLTLLLSGKVIYSGGNGQHLSLVDAWMTPLSVKKLIPSLAKTIYLVKVKIRVKRSYITNSFSGVDL